MRRGYRWAAVVAAAVGLGGVAGTAHAVGFSQPVVENVNTHPGTGYFTNPPSAVPFFGFGDPFQTLTIGPLGPHSNALVGMQVGVGSTAASTATPVDFTWEIWSGPFNGVDYSGMTLRDSGTAMVTSSTYSLVDIEFNNLIPVSTGDPFAVVLRNPTQFGAPVLDGLQVGLGLPGNPDSYPGGQAWFDSTGLGSGFAPYIPNGGGTGDWHVALYVNVPEPGSLATTALLCFGAALGVLRRRSAV